MKDLKELNEQVDKIVEALITHKTALQDLREEIARIDGVMVKLHELNGIFLAFIKKC
jgi:septal ring factor EnvC (AmiA/AmiB activator)